MRFNSKELCLLVQQSVHFDLEGYLLMKDKQEGLFKKSEAYINRYVKLKGNLMFYFKNKDSKQDPIGVLILERCAVELDTEENGFLLLYEGEDHAFRFAASSEEERDRWIQALHIASHECLKMQFQSLREQLQARTGRDPVGLPAEPSSSVDFESHSENASEDPVLEISISCSNLPCDSSDVPPNPLVVVHTMLPPQQQIWLHHNHTEIVERCNTPHFLKTIGFGDRYGVDTSTRIRLTVHHVVERMTGTMNQLGQAIFTLQDVLLNPELTLELNLNSHDMKNEGKVKITAWINDERVSLTQLKTQQTGCYSRVPRSLSMGRNNHNLKDKFHKYHQENPQCMVVGADNTGCYNRRPRSVSLGKHNHNLKDHFTNIIKRSFRFATNDEKSMLQVSEYMAESLWTYEMPVKLLKLWVTEEKRMVKILQDMGELVSEWEKEQIEWITQGADTAEFYTNSVGYLSEDEGITMKKSVDKGKEELEFVPVNLHIGRMVVTSDAAPKGKLYDVTTAGAFTAFCRDRKAGGLRRLLHQLRASYTPDNSPSQRTKIQRACSMLNKVTELRMKLKSLCEKLNQSADEGNIATVNNVIETMKEKVDKLNSICGDSLLQAASEAYLSAKRNANTSEGSDSASLSNMSEFKEQSDNHQSWKWSGSAFVKSPTMEPWEVTKLNLEAAFVCVMSVVDEVSNAPENSATHKLSEIKPAVSKLEGFIEVVWARISLFLNFLAIMENKDHVKTANECKVQRDVVNAHAITTLVSAFASCTQRDDLLDPQFTKQLSTVGILCQFEGLLSCHGNELSMIEDVMVAVDDLTDVSFRLVEAVDDQMEPIPSLGSYVREGSYPCINRHNIIINMPVQRDIFHVLPQDLKDGKLIKVTPVFFNIGINEKATLAEKFGSVALQEKLNMDSFAKLYEYYSQYNSHFDDPLDKSLGVRSLSHMIKLLQNNVMTKKSKNVELLHSAAEVTRTLRGLRGMFCKSGKDRTSMGVTLEMVQILQRHHDLALHVFTQSLDCLRSVGCRRENTLKNTGVKKYAFISLQMLYIPKLYRAPSGTYGNVDT